MFYRKVQRDFLIINELFLDSFHEFHKATMMVSTQHYSLINIEKFGLIQKMQHIQLFLIVFVSKEDLFQKLNDSFHYSIADFFCLHI